MAKDKGGGGGGGGPQLPPITQKVILEVQELLGNSDKKAVALFKDLSKNVDLVNKSLSNLEKQGKATTTSLQKIAQGFGAVGAAISATASMVTGFAVGIFQSQQEYMNFIKAVSGGSKALANLRSAYDDNIRKTGENIISMRELSKAMRELADQGVAQSILAGQKETQLGMLQLTSFLATKVGPTMGSELASGLMQGLSDNIPAIQSILGRDFMAEQTAGIERASMDLLYLGEAGIAAAIKLDSVRTAVDGAIQPLVSMDQITGRLSSMWSRLQDVIAKAVGPTVGKWLSSLDSLIKSLTDNMESFSQSISGFLVAVMKVIGDIGKQFTTTLDIPSMQDGFEEFFTYLLYGFKNIASFAAKSLGTIARVSAWLIGIFDNELGAKLGAFYVEMDILSRELGTTLPQAAGQFQSAVSQVAKSTADDINKPTTEFERLADKIKESLVSLEKLDKYSKGLDSMSTAMGTLGSLTELASGQFEIAGMSAADLINTLSDPIEETVVGKMKEVTEDAIKAQLENLRNARELAKTAKDRYVAEQQIQAQIENVNRAISIRVKQLQAQKAAFEAMLKPAEAQLSMISKQKAVQESALKISQQLYGTPALAVENQLKLVETTQREKENLDAQLKSVRQFIKEQKEAGKTEEDLFVMRQKELDLQKDLADKTAEQLGMLKQLRDGYLDAVQAQAFGAGRFEKIIISQEKNVMRGLQLRAVKASYLIGQLGKAGKSLQSIRFSGQAYGMEAGGQMMDADMVAERQAQIQATAFTEKDKKILDIANAVTKGATEQASQITESQDRQTAKIVDPLYQIAKNTAAMAGLPPGAPATTTGLGAAVGAVQQKPGTAFVGPHAPPSPPSNASITTTTTSQPDSVLGLCEQMAKNLDAQKQIIITIGTFLENQTNTNNTSPVAVASPMERAYFD